MEIEIQGTFYHNRQWKQREKVRKKFGWNRMAPLCISHVAISSWEKLIASQKIDLRSEMVNQFFFKTKAS